MCALLGSPPSGPGASCAWADRAGPLSRTGALRVYLCTPSCFPVCELSRMSPSPQPAPLSQAFPLSPAPPLAITSAPGLCGSKAILVQVLALRLAQCIPGGLRNPRPLSFPCSPSQTSGSGSPLPAFQPQPLSHASVLPAPVLPVLVACTLRLRGGFSVTPETLKGTVVFSGPAPTLFFLPSLLLPCLSTHPAHMLTLSPCHGHACDVAITLLPA